MLYNFEESALSFSKFNIRNGNGIIIISIGRLYIISTNLSVLGECELNQSAPFKYSLVPRHEREGKRVPGPHLIHACVSTFKCIIYVNLATEFYGGPWNVTAIKHMRIQCMCTRHSFLLPLAP